MEGESNKIDTQEQTSYKYWELDKTKFEGHTKDEPKPLDYVPQ